MRMNHGYLGEGSLNIPLNEELNVDTTTLIELLKDSCKTHGLINK